MLPKSGLRHILAHLKKKNKKNTNEEEEEEEKEQTKKVYFVYDVTVCLASIILA